MTSIDHLSSIQRIEESKKAIVSDTPKRTPLGISEAFSKDTISSAKNHFSIADIEKNSPPTQTPWLPRYINLCMKAEQTLNAFAAKIENSFEEEDKVYNKAMVEYAKKSQTHLEKTNSQKFWSGVNDIITLTLSVAAMAATVAIIALKDKGQLTKRTGIILGLSALSIVTPPVVRKTFSENPQSKLKSLILLSNTMATIAANLSAFQMVMPEVAISNAIGKQLLDKKTWDFFAGATKGIGFVVESITQWKSKSAERAKILSDSQNGISQANISGFAKSMEQMQENEKNLFSQAAEAISAEVQMISLLSSSA